MELIENRTFDEERALYGSSDVTVRHCRFDGPADGESALKESSGVAVADSYFNLRYPFWHVDGLTITSSEMTDKCRAAIWYSKDIKITDTKLHGIKALRECADVVISGSSIISPEFGWSVKDLKMTDTTAESEYFLMRSSDIVFENVKFTGKYSFQYVENVTISNCELNTKDAFWHAKNVTVKDSVVNGEYLGWYSENLTFINCKIKGTQPLCYCKELTLINCAMEDCDLAFERSQVDATITTPVISIKNPLSGHISVPEVGEVIRDIPGADGEIVIG
ncbi:DUF3737 family protein [Butyrivibrio sp. AE2032]|uniref:DUF3737 family protein n=1 Tax=Butyrivibrio sp. AE2032 TaxID=1458463 RepID=UPI0005575738|nr:DUF3737 family protein [Butyrivibrio sp. AE2032]